MSRLLFLSRYKKFIVFGLLLWQLVSIYLIVIGSWPMWVVWLNTALVVSYILFASAFNGLLLVVTSMAFYVVLPQHYSDTLNMWRLVVGVLFLKTLFVSLRGGGSATTKQSLKSVFADFRLPRRSPSGAPRNDNSSLGRLWHGLLSYEKVAIALFVLGIISLVLARYPLRGASQLVFLLNTALVYPIVVWTVKNREQFIRLLKYGVFSTGAIIALGYVQFIATLFSTTYFFWQYWALRVVNLYYGWSLAQVSLYSNSWVTVSGEEKTLRMFSIMPSSHAFAMVCVFFLAFALPLLYIRHDEDAPRQRRRGASSSWLWAGIVLACLALILSGTRGVWVGMLPALVIAAVLYYWNRFALRKFITPIYGAMLVVVILFTASPLIDASLGFIRHAGQSTLDRVESIVDTGETSNAGRLAMWKAAGAYALHHPLGVGYANFVVTLSPDSNNVSFEEAASRENKLYNLPQRYITAHSLYLQLLVELSLLGLLLFGLFWLLFFYKAWMHLRLSTSPSLSFERRGTNADDGSSITEVSSGSSHKVGEVRRGMIKIGVSPETVYIATLSVVFLWFLVYSVFDVTWLNDKILLYTFVALGLVRVVLTKIQDKF